MVEEWKSMWRAPSQTLVLGKLCMNIAEWIRSDKPRLVEDVKLSEREREIPNTFWCRVSLEMTIQESWRISGLNRKCRMMGNQSGSQLSTWSTNFGKIRSKRCLHDICNNPCCQKLSHALRPEEFSLWHFQKDMPCLGNDPAKEGLACLEKRISASSLHGKVPHCTFVIHWTVYLFSYWAGTRQRQWWNDHLQDNHDDDDDDDDIYDTACGDGSANFTDLLLLQRICGSWRRNILASGAEHGVESSSTAGNASEKKKNKYFSATRMIFSSIGKSSTHWGLVLIYFLLPFLFRIFLLSLE